MRIVTTEPMIVSNPVSVGYTIYDDMDTGALVHLFNALPVNDQMRVLSNLFSVHMLNSFGINVPDDFLSYPANTMFQLRHGQCTNVLYNLAKGIL